MQLDGRVVVVTGAAQGNGLAISQRLAAEGALVVMGDRNSDLVSESAAAIRGDGGKAEGVTCDVTDPGQVEAMMARAEELGGPHAVVAQAGGSFGGGVEATSPEAWDALMDVDVKGTFLTVRAALPRMRKLGGGSIVTMSGTFAWWAEPGVAAHCAAKAAILAFTRAVAVEYGHLGIRCNAIAPGYVATPMVRNYFESEAGGEETHRVVAGGTRSTASPSPRRSQTLRCFLCSDESSFCSGQPFTVDGA